MTTLKELKHSLALGGNVKSNPYRKAFPYNEIDIYRILEVYEVTDPCIQHAIKKLLCAGKRGSKDVAKDILEAQMSIDRWFEMRKEEDGNQSNQSGQWLDSTGDEEGCANRSTRSIFNSTSVSC